MALPVNNLDEGVINPTEIATLETPETFRLDSDHKSLVIVNASLTETANVTVKGTRDNVAIPLYGLLDISNGLPIVIAPLGVATIVLPLMYKHLGEEGDFITVSTDSIEKQYVLCWITE